MTQKPIWCCNPATVVSQDRAATAQVTPLVTQPSRATVAVAPGKAESSGADRGLILALVSAVSVGARHASAGWEERDGGAAPASGSRATPGLQRKLAMQRNAACPRPGFML